MSENNQDPFKKCTTCGSEEIANTCIVVIFDQPIVAKQCPVCLQIVNKSDNKIDSFFLL
ncbi:MAG: hypothetical protein PHX25_02145 [Candidatus Pacebacteria bacterium]|nr:hypothetical protein [Candidatus Paceibacterota bacterium]